MTFARISGILFLASTVWIFSPPDGTSVYAFTASIAASVFCMGVLVILSGKEAFSERRAGAAAAAFVWFLLGMVYLKFLSPPSDIGGALLAGLGIIAMIVVAVWMIVDEDLAAGPTNDRP
jgi:hypothetical protein